MECKFVSPTETKMYKNIDSILIPTTNGPMQVLKNHAQAIISSSSGKIILKRHETIVQEVDIQESIVYINSNVVTFIS